MGHEAKQVNGVANRGQHRGRCFVSLLPALARGGVVCTCACASRPASPHLRLFLASAYSFRGQAGRNGKRISKDAPRTDSRERDGAAGLIRALRASWSRLKSSDPPHLTLTFSVFAATWTCSRRCLNQLRETRVAGIASLREQNVNPMGTVQNSSPTPIAPAVDEIGSLPGWFRMVLK